MWRIVVLALAVIGGVIILVMEYAFGVNVPKVFEVLAMLALMFVLFMLIMGVAMYHPPRR